MSSRSTIAFTEEMAGCAGGEPRVRPVWLRIAGVSSLAGRILRRGVLYRRTEPERVLRAMTRADDGRRLLRDAAVARVRCRHPHQENLMAARFRTLTRLSRLWSAAALLAPRDRRPAQADHATIARFVERHETALAEVF